MARLPILMYHNITQDTTKSKGLSISQNLLEKHFMYLKEKGYETFHFSELEKFGTSKMPKKSIIITFDDVYVNQLKYAYPLLKKYNMKASFFAPLAFINGFDSWNTGEAEIMSVEQLKSLDERIIELGLHSYNHVKYNEISADEIEEDFKKCKQFIAEHDLPVKSILAYPYGKYPRTNPDKSTFFEMLKHHQISYGLRIGNRINSFPFKSNYEVQRLDIKGEDSLTKFKLKLKFGKLKLF